MFMESLPVVVTVSLAFCLRAGTASGYNVMRAATSDLREAYATASGGQHGTYKRIELEPGTTFEPTDVQYGEIYGWDASAMLVIEDKTAPPTSGSIWCLDAERGAKCKLDGAGARRIMSVIEITIQFRGLLLTRGVAPSIDITSATLTSNEGGAILMYRSEVTLDNCEFTNNEGDVSIRRKGS
jgi:hypothetical protein